MSALLPPGVSRAVGPLLRRKSGAFSKVLFQRGASAVRSSASVSLVAVRPRVLPAHALEDPGRLARQRSEARAQMDQEAKGRVEERSDHLEQSDRKSLEQRVSRNLLGAALSEGTRAAQGLAANGGPAPSPHNVACVTPSPGERAQVDPGRPASRTQAVMELVEQVHAFVRSQRPALTLNLGGRLRGELEVEKVGPRSVSLRIRGGGAQVAKDVPALRTALAERGLTLAHVEVT